MERIYTSLIADHLQNYEQMIFLTGPRQVGKTTISKATCTLTNHFNYLNWDTQEERRLILQGPLHVGETILAGRIYEKKPIVVFDEIHKYKNWRIFLKGFFDHFKKHISIIVTGSAKLDIYRRGKDSLMGRYFPYRILPITLGELTEKKHAAPETVTVPPTRVASQDIENLWKFGGFPEPFLNHETRFSLRWQNLRTQQLFRGDIRDLSNIEELDQLELLAKLLQENVGQLINLSKLSQRLDVSVKTVKRWITTLEKFYYCFSIKPWSKNVTRALIKNPKIFLYDWSLLQDNGARAENFIATHLMKSVDFWTDSGLGQYELFFVRDKEKREVDFLITQNKKPWLLVEVKHGTTQSISEHLYRFQKQLNATHAFQVEIEANYIQVDCFQHTTPIIVPARTFLSQLV